MDDLERQIQSRQCGHKLKYPDREEARQAAKRMHKRYKAPFSEYLCPWGEHWHVGTIRSLEAARRRADRRTT